MDGCARVCERGINKVNKRLKLFSKVLLKNGTKVVLSFCSNKKVRRIFVKLTKGLILRLRLWLYDTAIRRCNIAYQYDI